MFDFCKILIFEVGVNENEVLKNIKICQTKTSIRPIGHENCKTMRRIKVSCFWYEKAVD